MNNKTHLSQAGFTLFELFVTVLIAGILVAMAIPNYQDFVKNNCLTTGTNTLVTTFQQARSEATKRKTNVTITANGAGWGSGWTITLKEDRNNNGTLDAGEDYDGDGAIDAAAMVRSVSLTCSQTTITETGGDTTFVYTSSGFIDAPGTFDVCDDRTGETGRQVTINTVGRPNTNSNYTGCG